MQTRLSTFFVPRTRIQNINSIGQSRQKRLTKEGEGGRFSSEGRALALTRLGQDEVVRVPANH